MSKWIGIGMKISGKQLPGKCIPMTLINSIGKGGLCAQTNECKGNLQCVDGVCTSVNIDLDMEEFLSDPAAIASEREENESNLFKNPLSKIVEDKPAVDLEDSQKINCNSTKDCLKHDKHAKCVKGKCEKEYKSCNVKNSRVCSKLGDVGDLDKSDKSFVKKRGCCEEPNSVCVHNPDVSKTGKDGVCVDLGSSLNFDYSLVSEYNLPNRIKCIKNSNCASGFCNKKSGQCESIFQAARECDSLYPCVLSEECVNGTCVPVDKMTSKSGKSHSACGNKDACADDQICLGVGEKEDRDKLEIFKSITGKEMPIYPLKKSIRLFNDTHCGFESIEKENFPYIHGMCEAKLEKIQEFQIKMKDMKDRVYDIFKSRLGVPIETQDTPQVVGSELTPTSTETITTSSSKKITETVVNNGQNNGQNNRSQRGGAEGDDSIQIPKLKYRPARSAYNVDQSMFNFEPTTLSKPRQLKTTLKTPSKLGLSRITNFPKLMLFNNFDYENFDNAASFDIFDYTSQNGIIYFNGKYILAKVYFQLRNPFHDDDTNSPMDFTYDLLVMFIDHGEEEVKNGFELNDMGEYVRCFYSGNTKKFAGIEKYEMFEPFPEEFGITNNIRGGYSPFKNNPNVLLVPNLFLYEYLVFLLFGERIACSPYKKYGYVDPKGGILKNEKGFNRGFYQYSLRYDGLSKKMIDNLVEIEANWGQSLGYYGTIDIPYTTIYRASDIEGRKLKGFFLGTDALGITPDIFKKVYTIWTMIVKSSSYSKLSPSIIFSLRKNNSQSFLLRFKEDSKFKKEYVRLGENISKIYQRGGASNASSIKVRQELLKISWKILLKNSVRLR